MRILAGVGPIRSLRALEFMRSGSPGWPCPTRWSAGCAACPPTGWPTRAWRLCAETVAALREITGVAGVHVMAVGVQHGVPEILQRAGLAG